MKKYAWLLIMVFIFSWTGYAQTPESYYGTASGYNRGLDGKKTASGQRYNPNSLTGAHKDLPFGTLVEIESLENGKKVQVIINDRGPADANRLIYLSEKAVVDIGHKDEGTFYVKVTVLKKGTGVITNLGPEDEYFEPETNTVVTNDSTSAETESIQSTNTNIVAYSEKIVERELGDNSVDLAVTDGGDESGVDVDLIDESLVSNDVAPMTNTNAVVVEIVPESTAVETNESGTVEPETLTNDIPNSETIMMDTNDIVLTIPEVTNITGTAETEVETNVIEVEEVDTNMQTDLIAEDDLVQEDDLSNNQGTTESEIRPETREADPWKKYEPRGNPEILLTNMDAIYVEKDEINKELVVEIKTPEEKPTNTMVQPETNRQIGHKDLNQQQRNVEERDPVAEEIPDRFKEKDAVKIDEKDGGQGKKEPDKRPENNIDTADSGEPEYQVDAMGYSYAIQVGAFTKHANAMRLYEKLKKKGYPVFITQAWVKGRKFTRVRVGYYGSLTRARQIQKLMKSLKLPAIIVKIKLKEVSGK